MGMYPGVLQHGCKPDHMYDKSQALRITLVRFQQHSTFPQDKNCGVANYHDHAGDAATSRFHYVTQ
ncbi:hypothetical protein AOE01nite_13860 [Acetobacter oeni]|uniref:Uncharacterized protein n=1 Tax=Acetobacter oeni TaxID=304077 RepID=A0A511XJP3_9PROT|nr:hypothetical protein AA21952_0178 [Acetobacter oeni LMG 21952]GEN63162.1 hypothetical protein AOE01nite_13860 [Acetobacter oeni]